MRTIDTPDTGIEPVGWNAGARAKGEFKCSDCGYGVTVYRTLPVCPMCRSEQWERVPWRPFSRTVRRVVTTERD